MKNIYMHKNKLNQYQEFPVPKNIDNYYKVNVEDSFNIDNKIYNPETRMFDPYTQPTIWTQIRSQRDSQLRQTDWTQLSDIPQETQEKYKTYRQELRDVTTQSDPNNIIWPIRPE